MATKLNLKLSEQQARRSPGASPAEKTAFFTAVCQLEAKLGRKLTEDEKKALWTGRGKPSVRGVK